MPRSWSLPRITKPVHHIPLQTPLLARARMACGGIKAPTRSEASGKRFYVVLIFESIRAFVVVVNLFCKVFAETALGVLFAFKPYTTSRIRNSDRCRAASTAEVTISSKEGRAPSGPVFEKLRRFDEADGTSRRALKDARQGGDPM